MLTPEEFEQLLANSQQLAAQGGADSQRAQAVYDNLNEIKAAILAPKTPANKTHLLELIVTGKKLVGIK
jgi:hypothetical protein